MDKHFEIVVLLLLCQVSGGFARVLSSLGLLINSVGGETEIDLAAYTFSGTCMAANINQCDTLLFVSTQPHAASFKESMQ
jgi:hypothetical protein